MKTLRSYPKVWAIGHPNTDTLFDGSVVVQEKVDGSQFSFGMVNGDLHMRSRGAEIYLPVKDKLFKGAAKTASALFDGGLLVDGWVYRGEVLRSPKHNSLKYERVPAGNVILFDIDTGLERRLAPVEVRDIAETLGLEVVPTIYEGTVADVEQIKDLLRTEPHLGGEMIEGIVVKNYARFLHDGKQLMGKFVAEKFREVHSREWKAGNPGRVDVIQQLIASLHTKARFEKAVQRRRESGELLNAPQDIGPLMHDLGSDLETEEAAFIKEKLYEAFQKQIIRGASAGFPAWYKDRLLKRAFEDELE